MLTGLLDTQTGSLTPHHVFTLELEIMVSHSGQEGRFQVLEVSPRAELGWRGGGVPGQGHAGLEDGRAWVWSLWKEGDEMQRSA